MGSDWLLQIFLQRFMCLPGFDISLASLTQTHTLRGCSRARRHQCKAKKCGVTRFRWWSCSMRDHSLSAGNFYKNTRLWMLLELLPIPAQLTRYVTASATSSSVSWYITTGRRKSFNFWACNQAIFIYHSVFLWVVCKNDKYSNVRPLNLPAAPL